MSRVCKSFAASLRFIIGDIRNPYVTSVRYRYHSAKIERGHINRKVYVDTIHTEGLLPHSKEYEDKMRKIGLKDFKPVNYWGRKRAFHGVNDYIDILGDGNIHPAEVLYSVPPWLRGFKGNEYQMLIRRHNDHGHNLKELHPTRYNLLQKRKHYLYNYLNRKTKDYFWKNP